MASIVFDLQNDAAKHVNLDSTTLGAGGGVPPYMGYIGICGPKRYGFSAVLVINRVWFLYASLDMGMLLRRSYFFIISKKKINKSASQMM